MTDLIKELAADAFEKQERVRMLEMMSTPIDYEARKAAFVQLAEACASAEAAKKKLDNYATSNKSI